MDNNLEFYKIDAFTQERFNGNPAAVIYSDDLSDIQMQLIAREMNLSETAFLSKSDKADFKLRWFTPKNEVDLCGHATIASLHYLSETNPQNINRSITFETRSGILECSAGLSNYTMQIPIPQMNNFDGCKEELLSALNIERVNLIDVPFIILDNGYLFIGVNSIKELWKLKPDFKSLVDLSKTKKDFYDIVVYTTETIDESSSAHLRFFAPYIGIDEDPVTGSACGPLLLVLQKLNLLTDYKDGSTVIFEQGDVLGRKGRVHVKFNSDIKQLRISGSAVTVMKGNLFL